MAFIDDLLAGQTEAIEAAIAEREEVSGIVTALEGKLTAAEDLVKEGGTPEQHLAALAAAQELTARIKGIYTAPVVEPPVDPVEPTSRRGR